MPNIIKRILSYPIFKFKVNYSKLNPRNFRWTSFKSFLKGVGILIIFLGAFIVVKDEIYYQLGLYDDGSTEETAKGDNQEDENCNVLGIELHGEIVTYLAPSSLDEEANTTEDQVASEYIMGAIQQAEEDEKIKAILIEIDSYGGSPVAAEEIANELKNAKKPTVALIRGAGLSAAYWSATGADTIIASAISDVGSIGVTNSYVDNSKKNIKEGLTYNSLSTGKFKDYGDPDKPLTEAERQLIMRDAYIIHDNFINVVATNRNLDSTKVRALADGSSMLGEAALQNGLIDKVGRLDEVKSYLKEKIGEDMNICW